LSTDVKYRNHERTWWKEAVIYEVYLPSFKDSNDDGIGDLTGVLSKLDHLKDLRVDVVSVGPFYQSPQIDMGYDISSYEDVDKRYGTLEDVDALIKATHARGMRIIFDLVINHSSNLHKWFQESRSSKTNPKRDWYVWRPARIDAQRNRHPPNNWRSHFTVPAWTWDEKTQEYYLHIYTPEMPDFNWENEDCRKAIYQTAMTFWLDRGIDGFRIDTVNKYSKNQTYPDAEISDPEEETQLASMHYRHGPRIHEYLREMRTTFDRYGAMSWGELSNFKRDEEEVLPFVSSRSQELNMVNNLDIVNFGQDRGNRKVPPPFLVSAFKKEMSRWQDFVAETDAWVTILLENHDQ
jgi:glycosidase